MKLPRKTLLAMLAAVIALPVSPFVVAGFIFIASLFTDAHSAEGGVVNYTVRRLPPHACDLFAKDAYQAAEHRAAGADMELLIGSLQSASVADSMKERAFQAVQYVWAHEIDNPHLAYTLAMGACLKPRKEMSPMLEPWLTNPRTFKNAL